MKKKPVFNLNNQVEISIADIDGLFKSLATNPPDSLILYVNMKRYRKLFGFKVFDGKLPVDNSHLRKGA